MQNTSNFIKFGDIYILKSSKLMFQLINRDFPKFLSSFFAN